MLLLHIDEPDGTGDFPIELFVAADDGTWPADPVAHDRIPANLDVGGAPCGHGEMDVAGIRDFLLGERGESDHFGCIGAHLYALVARGEVDARWCEERDAAQTTLLHVVPDDLRRLPWELMNDGAPLFLEHAISRVTEKTPAIPPPVDLPVRLLVIVGAAPKDDHALADSELIAVRRALGKLNGAIDPVVLLRPPKPELDAALADHQPHIVHFAGHAVKRSGQTALKIEVESATWYWKLDGMVFPLNAGRPRLVILNACRTADTAPPAEAAATQRHVHDLVERLISDIGVHDVVGMQADIGGESAVHFTRRFYAEIGNGQTIDRAMVLARNEIKSNTDIRRREWALPTLVSSAIPGAMIATKDIPADVWTSITGSPEFAELPSFVDRERERAMLRASVLAPTDAATMHPQHLFLMKSPETTRADKYGKSELAKWCVRQALFMGLEVRYVNLASIDSMGLIDVLKRIRDGAPGSRITRPVSGQIIDGIDLEVGATLSTDDLGRIVASFRDGLIEAAAPKPFLLILDHLWGVSTGALNTLEKHIDKFVGGSTSVPVRVVLVANGETMKNKVPAVLDLAAETIDVAEIDRALLEPLLVQFLCHNIQDPEQIAEAADALGRAHDAMGWEQWQPGYLKRVLGA